MRLLRLNDRVSYDGIHEIGYIEKISSDGRWARVVHNKTGQKVTTFWVDIQDLKILEGEYKYDC